MRAARDQTARTPIEVDKMSDTSTTYAQEPEVASAAPSGSVSNSKRWDIKRGGELFALLLLILVFSLTNRETFPTLVNLQAIVDQASVPLIIGVGATLVILLGCIDLSVEGVMSVCGVSFVLLSANSRMTMDLGFWAVVAGVALGAALGLANGLIHTLLRVPSFIVTLGMGFVGFGLSSVVYGTDSLPMLNDGGIKEWPANQFLSLPYSFWLAAVVVTMGVLVSRYTRLGRFTYAIGNSEPIARSNGVPVNRYKVIVFTVAGACSGLAGVLTTMQLGSSPAQIGAGMLFLTIAAVVIGGTSLGGGKGGIMRTTVGVLILTILNNGLLIAGVSVNIRSAVSGGILIVAIVAAAWPYRSRLRIMK